MQFVHLYITFSFIFLRVLFTEGTDPVPTQSSLNCTNIPYVQIHLTDAQIDALILSANNNIKVWNQILPFLNAYIANLKVPGVCNQIDEIMNVLKALDSRIEILNRRLDCGLVTSIQETGTLKQMSHNDQTSNRVIQGIKMRLTDVKQQLQAIVQHV